MIKGLVACGSGIATSTVAQQAVKKYWQMQVLKLILVKEISQKFQ